jgi:hypothetical protein
MKLEEIAKELKLKIPDGKKVSHFYDAEADVLEIYFGDLQISESVIEDINDRYSLQFNPKTNEMTGITIRNFNKLLNWYFE